MPAPELDTREIGEALSRFWTNGGGPTRDSVFNALQVAGDLRPYDNDGNKASYVLRSVTQAVEDATGRSIIEQLLRLLRETSTWDDPAYAGARQRAMQTADEHGHRISSEGKITWNGTKTPTPRTGAATARAVGFEKDKNAPRDTGRWKIIRALSPGCQGEVFLVSGVPHDGVGVLKRLPRNRFENNKARVRFLREIVILRRLDHPFILRVLDAHTSGEDPWLVTQFAPYGCVADHVETLRGDAWRCLRLARDLASALGAAHAEKIVHRDVKPKNVLLFNLDTPALGDFGIAHDADATSVTSDHERVGARCFSPPEWEHGHIQPTPVFDVYSLGKLIYYMVVGGKCPPRERYLDAEWNLIEVLGDPSMERINQLLSLTVVEKPEARLQSMTEFVRAIDRTLADLFGPANRRPPRLDSATKTSSCPHCYVGTYRDAGAWSIGRAADLTIDQGAQSIPLTTFRPRMIVCDHCGDVRIIFEMPGGLRTRPEWVGSEE